MRIADHFYDRDAYRAGAAECLGKAFDLVTETERQRFKRACLCAVFHGMDAREAKRAIRNGQKKLEVPERVLRQMGAAVARRSAQADKKT